MTSGTVSNGDVLSEHALRTVFDSVNDAILIHDAETGAISAVNQPACEMYGYSREELRTLTVGDLRSDVDSLQAVTSQGHQVDREGSDITEWRAKAHDGEGFWVEASTSRATVDGEVQMLVVLRDISDRKKQQQELDELRTQLDLTLKETGTGIWEWNLATDELSWDETSERLFGFEPGDFPGRFEAFTARLLDEDRQCIERALQRAVDTDTEYHAEFRVELPDGERRWIHARGVVEYDDQGEPDRLLGVQRDVTDRVTQTQQITDQRDSLELLNSVVRHDIRNDLQLVDAYSEMLTDHVDERGDGYLSMVRKGTTNALDLTEMARELAEVILHPDRKRTLISVRSVLKTQIMAVRDSYPDAEISIEQSLPETTAVADELLDAVFRNLLKNAVQHNDSSTPVVVVSGELRDEHVEIRIADNGPGVADAWKDVIFGKGEQGLDSDGTGIGLFLVQSLVDGYGGAVWVEDNTPSGAVFVVRLPVND